MSGRPQPALPHHHPARKRPDTRFQRGHVLIKDDMRNMRLIQQRLQLVYSVHGMLPEAVLHVQRSGFTLHGSMLEGHKLCENGVKAFGSIVRLWCIS